MKKNYKEKIYWAIDMIEQNRLEEMELSTEKKDIYEDNWLKMATTTDTTPKTWCEKDLDDALNEIHRESEEQAKVRIEGQENYAKRYLEMTHKEWILAGKLTDDLKTEFYKQKYEIVK